MTTETAFDTAVTDRETFESLLGELLLAANRNSVDIRGALTFRHEDPIPDWEVVVTRLTSEESSD